MAAKWTAFVSGAVLTAQQLNDTVDNFADIAIFNETQANNTQGGTNVAATWTKRTLNTTVVNNITNCSIASSVITLPAGTFLITGGQPMFNVYRMKTKLRNTTAGTDAIIGNSVFTNNTDDASFIAPLCGVVTTTANTNFELQYYGQQAYATSGLGLATNASTSEVYGYIQIVRIA